MKAQSYPTHTINTGKHWFACIQILLDEHLSLHFVKIE